MPPKATDAAIAEATKDTAFLATCFMNMRTKPAVDSAAVAEKMSMSVGGVRNKLRPIIKAMEDAGALWTADQPSTPTHGSAAQPASKTTKNKPQNEAVAEMMGTTQLDTMKKKVKNQRKSSAKTVGSSTKHSRMVDHTEIDEEGTVTEDAPRKKKAKVSPSPATEQQNEVNTVKEFKKEPGLENDARD